MRLLIYDGQRLHASLELPPNVISEPEKWSLTLEHIQTVKNWPDWFNCLTWAMETEATVQEMKAWHRALHGNDLTEV